jgi:aryl-alcohol dehydrogenase-like predicted oxidoreductase
MLGVTAKKRGANQMKKNQNPPVRHSFHARRSPGEDGSDGGMDRRDFFKAAGAAGIGSLIAARYALADANQPAEPNNTQTPKKAKYPQLPKRRLGRADVEVPILCNGLMFNVVDDPVILRASLRYGVTYWDTANGYAGGNSEIGIGDLFRKDPDIRKDIFLVTKASGAYTSERVEEKLQESLKRLNTDYIDLFYGVHGCSNPERQLTDELGRWADGAKKRKLIKYFGFSTHSNMAACLTAAAKLPWIDAVMSSYNISLMLQPEMKDAVQACHEAGVAVIAMKTLLGRQGLFPEAEDKLTAHLLEKGFNREQALIKVVLDDRRIAAACVRMENVSLLQANVAAVLDKTKLTPDDLEALRQYAAETRTGYCAGCADICAAAVPEMPYTAEVMRYLMYHKSYGDTEHARELFARLPADARRRLLSADYSAAEARCPQRMPIAKLMAEAARRLA